jgi:hypothetical protein
MFRPFAPVAQLDRALASGAKGCGFDPRRAQNVAEFCQFATYLSEIDLNSRGKIGQLGRALTGSEPWQNDGVISP